MGLINRPVKTTSGTTEFVDNTDIEASEWNGDINPVYTLVNGNLDSTNLPALPWSAITGTPDPEDIDDTSGTLPEQDTCRI